MEYAGLQFYLNVILAVIMVANLIYTWFLNRDRVSTARIKDVERAIESHRERLARAEERLKSAPTHADMGALHERINAVYGSLEKLAGEVSGLSRNVNLIHQHLLEERRQ